MSVVENKSFHKSSGDKLKLYAAVLCVVIGVIGFNLSVFNSVLVQSVFLVVLCALGAFLIFTSTYGRQFNVFFKEAKIELRRVVWPTMTETKQMTFAVMVVIAITIVFLMTVDGVLRYLLQLFISLR